MKTRIIHPNLMVFALALLIYSLNGSGQTLKVSPDAKLITYDTIINFEGNNAEKLFDKTKAWFVENFRDAKEVIRGENKPDLIKGTFITQYAIPMSRATYENDITVRLKDGAIKITINRFVMDGKTTLEDSSLKRDTGKTTSEFHPMYKKTFIDIQTKWQELATSLKAFIEKKHDF